MSTRMMSIQPQPEHRTEQCRHCHRPTNHTEHAKTEPRAWGTRTLSLQLSSRFDLNLPAEWWLTIAHVGIPQIDRGGRFPSWQRPRERRAPGGRAINTHALRFRVDRSRSCLGWLA